MSLEQIRARLPEYAKDLKLNLGSVLTPQGAPGLSDRQIRGVALASAIAARNAEFVAAVERYAAEQLDAQALDGARAAAAIMGMNNVYYRSVHLLGDDEYAKLPARLRMNVIGNPGIDKTDFELYSLAASAVNGCGMCLDSHERVLSKAGLGREAVQSALRIAAVVHAVAALLDYIDGEPSAQAEAA